MHPKYKTPEEMQGLIDEYFKECEGRVLTGDDGAAITDKYGSPVIVGAKPPTVTGLALALGFTSRQALLNYQAKKQFVDTVTRAKSRIEEYTEGRLFDRDGVKGAIFSLSHNFKGWKDTDGENDDVMKKLDEVLSGIDKSCGESNGI